MIAKRSRRLPAAAKSADAGTPLLSGPCGSKVRLVAVRCDRRMAARLESMGLRPGVEIELIRRSGRGPVVVGVGNSRFALGRDVASRLLVSRASRS